MESPLGTAAPTPCPRRWRGDAIGVGIIVVLTVVVALNLSLHDNWLGRHDVLAFFLPWYAYLGDRLAAGDIPGWNPHLFSGTPFAGDPESGWTYLPAMLTFPFFPAATAFKVMVFLQLLVAGLTTYAFGRVMGLGVVAGLLAANLFEFGGFLYQNTYCCTVRAQVATWIPLSLLAVELALRARTWRGRLATWWLGGLAVSQFLAGWIGQGAMNALLLLAAYIAYRTLLAPPGDGWSWQRRVGACLAIGVPTLAFGLALGAAGILVRLAVNAQSNIPGGDYDALGQPSQFPPYRLIHIVWNIFGSGFAVRALSWGGAALVLALLAPFFARTRFGVPFFATLTVVVWTLTLEWTPLHELFFLIPGFASLHEHNAPQVTTIVGIGPAMLAGATLECLPRWRGRWPLALLCLLPLAVVWWAVDWLNEQEIVTYWTMPVAAIVVAALVGLVLIVPGRFGADSALGRVVQAVPVVVLIVAFLQPTGQELVEATTGEALDPAWTRQWVNDPVIQSAVATALDRDDQGGAGAFLRAQEAQRGPFRFAGYSGIGYDPSPSRSYPERRWEPEILALLANGRTMRLGLHDIQGYNPLQLRVYVDYLTALNGRTQNYHHANLLPAGFHSPLLNMLNVRFLLVDARIPADRPDVVALRQDRQEVFRNDEVVIYENWRALPHAWIVHDVRPATRADALALLAAGEVDPRWTALVEGAPPPLAPATGNPAETAFISRYEADAMVIEVNATAPGLLVLSEVWAEGWRAAVDGVPVEILLTDGALRGVPVTGGHHTVELTYAPRSLQIGLLLSGAALVAMLASFAAVAVSWTRGRSRRGSE